MDDGIYKATIERITELLVKKDLTVSRLSYLSGVSESTIKSILNGQSKNPGIVTLKKICDGLEITVGEFFKSPQFEKLEQEIK
ncbi:helix-turn-helix domain-containing protein [Aminipila sp.]|uniref:helix-turn-helix domain-containing protein n=1 Tax=Aminipila sp. TaxID=2060095 RepID=UPI00289FC6A8|nr:helix-turn-helix transcriptional regulator [Aminipila sp.]